MAAAAGAATVVAAPALAQSKETEAAGFEEALRAKFAAALLHTPRGVQEALYKTAAIACSPPQGRAAA